MISSSIFGKLFENIYILSGTAISQKIYATALDPIPLRSGPYVFINCILYTLKTTWSNNECLMLLSNVKDFTIFDAAKL